MDKIEKALASLESLPEGFQHAAAWVRRHSRLSAELCGADEPPLTEEAFQRELRRAVEKQDDLYYVLLVFQNELRKADRP